MKKLKLWIPTVAALLLCGCFQVQDELTLEPDGSGTVKITLHSNLPEEMTGMMGASSRYGTSVYPPSSEAEAQQYFPKKDFVVKVDEKSGDDGKTVRIEATFKNINALLASPYGRAHQLALKTNENGSLTLKALSGGSTLAQAAQFSVDDETMMGAGIPGLEEAKKKKGEMRFEFRVTLPNAVTAANQAHDQRTVTWTVERAKCKDDDEFAAKLAGILEASCGAGGIKFSPATPPRLGLVPFGQLTEGKVAAGSSLPDTNKILAAARFVPCALHVVRTLDLSGEASGQESQAQLSGAVLLPADLAPERWGNARLEEVTDAKGKSLMLAQDDDSRMSRFSFMERYDMTDQEEGDDSDEAALKKETTEKPHMIVLNFKAPEWKTKQISKVKAALDLNYLGGTEVLKLSNAVPAGMVMDMNKRSSFNSRFNSERGQLSNSRLSELGLSVRVQMAMVQSGMTMISLEAGGKSSLLDAQVFDADGRPWPTTVMGADSSGGDERSCQLLVAGKPKPPLSLALAVGGVGASVSLPILLENVPIGDK